MNNLRLFALSGLVLAAGCEYPPVEDFDVNSPCVGEDCGPWWDVADVETLIADTFRIYWLSTEQWYGPNGLSVAADELTSSWGNTAMLALSSEPRVAYDNSTTDDGRYHVEDPWFGLYSALYRVNDGLRVTMDPDDPVQIGSNGADTPRARAFGRFVQGISYGFLAAFFDQAYILDENTDMAAAALDPTLVPLSPYGDVMETAIGFLEQAISEAEGSDPFTIPSTWINGYPMTNELLAQVAHSYIARYTAAVARTPADRAAVDWIAVKDHASQGLSSSADDFGPWGDGYISWYSDHRWMAATPGWSRADYHTIGLADKSGNYDSWLATPLDERTEFVITTDDRRIHGATPDTLILPPDATDALPDTVIISAGQTPGTQFEYAGPSPFKYERGKYHYSMYGHSVWNDYAQTEEGQMISLSYTEMQLLIAEAEYRLGNLSAAADIVNVTRTAAGLAALDGTEPDFFKWLTYEKKIETFVRGAGLAFFDRRGWTNTTGELGQESDLISGTPLHFPVPAIELENAGFSIYTHGGTAGDYALKRIAAPRRWIQE